MGRVRYDLYSESFVGAIFTDRQRADGHNRVAGIDSSFRLDDTHSFGLRAVGSEDAHADGTKTTGYVLNASTDRFLFRNISEYNSLDKKLGLNALFTYRINAGTVFYAGYDDRLRQASHIDLDLNGDGITAYSADVERRIRGSGTRIPTKWNARRSAATIGQPVTSISVATGCRYPTRDLV